MCQTSKGRQLTREKQPMGEEAFRLSEKGKKGVGEDKSSKVKQKKGKEKTHVWDKGGVSMLSWGSFHFP
jgi:hypothetical protein